MNSKLLLGESFKDDINKSILFGNGVNLHAYKKEDKDFSWDSLLKDLWTEVTKEHIDVFPPGISFPELFDILCLHSSESAVREKLSILMQKFSVTKYHIELNNKLSSLNWPIITTNYDDNLIKGLSLFSMSNDSGRKPNRKLNKYYSNREFSNGLIGYEVWPIHGTVTNSADLKMGLTDYIGIASTARSFLHKQSLKDDFSNKTISFWKGYNTWLHIFFNSSICICGLTLDENETSLRWLLLERAKLMKSFPIFKHYGCYICSKEDIISQGHRMFLKSVGFKIVTLNSYDEIYDDFLMNL